MRTCLYESQKFGCIFSRCTGRFDLDDLKDLFQSLSALEGYRDGVPVLCDMTEVDFSAATGLEMLSAGRTQAGDLRGPVMHRFALVAQDEGAFGQLSVIAQMRSNTTHTSRVFRTIADGLAWLMIPKLRGVVPNDIAAEMENTLQSNVHGISKRPLIVMKDRVVA